MARLETYPYDRRVTDDDAWIGTEAGTNFTKQYTAADVAKYLNTNGKISSGTQMVYQYVSTSMALPGTLALEAGGGDTPFSSVTALTLSVTDKGFQNTSAFVNYLVGSDIIINKQKDLLQFGHFKVISYSLIDPDFYTINVSFVGGQGGFEDEEFYDVDNFLLASSISSDLHFTYTQSPASAVWNITHNLGKNPSVSVVDSAGSLVVGEVSYIDNNNLTITFISAFSGKAYLN
jgi:hypothetical protein